MFLRARAEPRPSEGVISVVEPVNFTYLTVKTMTQTTGTPWLVAGKPVNANPGLKVNQCVNFVLHKNVFHRLPKLKTEGQTI